jgi:hypothetical protein
MFDADEEDEARSRDIFWGGDADDGVRRLAEELGWEEELEKVIKEGRRELEEMWRELEGEEPPEEISGEEGRERAKVEAEKVAKELKIKEEETSLAIAWTGRGGGSERVGGTAASRGRRARGQVRQDNQQMRALFLDLELWVCYPVCGGGL